MDRWSLRTFGGDPPGPLLRWAAEGIRGRSRMRLHQIGSPQRTPELRGADVAEQGWSMGATRDAAGRRVGGTA
jgi:hypothetical protein